MAVMMVVMTVMMTTVMMVMVVAVFVQRVIIKLQKVRTIAAQSVIVMEIIMVVVMVAMVTTIAMLVARHRTAVVQGGWSNRLWQRRDRRVFVISLPPSDVVAFNLDVLRPTNNAARSDNPGNARDVAHEKMDRSTGLCGLEHPAELVEGRRADSCEQHIRDLGTCNALRNPNELSALLRPLGGDPWRCCGDLERADRLLQAPVHLRLETLEVRLELLRLQPHRFPYLGLADTVREIQL